MKQISKGFQRLHFQVTVLRPPGYIPVFYDPVKGVCVKGRTKRKRVHPTVKDEKGYSLQFRTKKGYTLQYRTNKGAANSTGRKRGHPTVQDEKGYNLQFRTKKGSAYSLGRKRVQPTV